MLLVNGAVAVVAALHSVAVMTKTVITSTLTEINLDTLTLLPYTYRMNTDKLVLWNMTQPYHKRVAAADLAKKVASARNIANLRALHRQVRAEVEAELAAQPTFEKVS
jgi:hypothetical protein